MADSRFFHNAGPISLEDIAALTGATASSASERPFVDVAPLETAGPGDVGFFDNVKYLESFRKSKAGACFVRPAYAKQAPAGMICLVTPEPYYAYAQLAQRFYPEPAIEPDISPQVFIAPTASIGAGVRIEAGAVIGAGVRIGKGCAIGANSVIGENVEIGDECRIGALCGVSHATLGNKVILHRGAQIGQDGFGFAPGPRGVLKVPQLGRVMIGNDVEIGANSCVDRGAGPDTVIGDHTKIDNLVQIGHNVRIGRYCFIAGQVGIAGSSHIGDGAMLGGQAGLSGHVAIGAGAKVAAQAGVMADIPPGETHGGFPALRMRDWHRQTVAIANLIKKKDEK